MRLDYNPFDRKIAYFSLEIGLNDKLPTYAGGLGILAGDTIKSFADKRVPVIAVTLLNRKGYFRQEIDDQGNQIEHEEDWNPQDHMTLMSEKVSVELEGRDVMLKTWIYTVEGTTGYKVPVLFLDSDLPANHEYDRELTSYLYGGDRRYRLKQEAILGIGGTRMLNILNHDELETYHMNEGHSALLTLELMNRHENDLEEVRDLCVFTTHTPVPAGHDRFQMQDVMEILRDYYDFGSLKHDKIIGDDDKLNMTYLALYHSRYINGVAKKHGEVAAKMFPEYNIDAITNGIHGATWVSKAMSDVFDRYIPSWREDTYALRRALSLPRQEIWRAHVKAKQELLEYVNENYDPDLSPHVLTLGFARRMTEYKRADLLFSDTEHLKNVTRKKGRIQIIYGGKAHPKDNAGKELIKRIHDRINDLKEKIDVVYLENYDIQKAKLLVAGSDVWLNTPMPPQEASGTSGMKAALNGVLNFSVQDGWWIEGCIEDFTGWSIGNSQPSIHQTDFDVQDLYWKLDEKIIPMYYENRSWWMEMMAYNIAFNASYFNTHRMVGQYIMKAYF